MRESRYWETIRGVRAGRRRLLQGMAAGAGGLVLAACGGGSKKQSDLTGLIAPTSTGTAAPADPFAGAKRGGTLNILMSGDPPTLDPYVQPATNTKAFASYVYSRLFRFKGGPGIRATDAKPTGDLAERAESTPDGLTWTITLRSNAKFHNLPPVNGRQVTTADVKYSWERATGEKGINRSSFDFVDKAAFPDDKTIVFTLKEPNAAFLEILSDANLLWVMPKEADGGFDPASTAVGSGPWVFQSYTPSSGMSLLRNPAWHENGFPLADAVNVSIIPEYANGLAQFQAGSLDMFAVNATDLVDLKKRMPDAQLQGDVSIALYYCYLDGNPSAPWRDARVRQAMSMALDRNAILDLAYNTKKLRAGGIDVKDQWNNVIPVAHSRFWLDPQSEAHGDSGKYFSYNLDEAKKLLAAAGFPNGFEAKFQYTGYYGATQNVVAEATAEFLNQLGIKTTTEVQDYSSKYYTQTYRGQFDGIAFGPETTFPEAGSYPIRQFTPNPLNKSRSTDATLEKLAHDQQREMDEGKRRDIFYEIQRRHATQMWLIPSALGGGTAWAVHQPWMRNSRDFGTPVSYLIGGEQLPYWWKDK